jgi:hypothetical protein
MVRAISPYPTARAYKPFGGSGRGFESHPRLLDAGVAQWQSTKKALVRLVRAFFDTRKGKCTKHIGELGPVPDGKSVQTLDIWFLLREVEVRILPRTGLYDPIPWRNGRRARRSFESLVRLVRALKSQGACPIAGAYKLATIALGCRVIGRSST